MTWTVPLTDVQLSEEDLAAVADCLRSGWLTMGPRTQAFEAAVADGPRPARRRGVFRDGRAAPDVRRARLGPGDEVIVPALTFVATANAARYVGATPVLADVVSPTAPNLDPADVERRITPRTKAVIAVHMWGIPLRSGRCASSATRTVCT